MAKANTQIDLNSTQYSWGISRRCRQRLRHLGGRAARRQAGRLGDHTERKEDFVFHGFGIVVGLLVGLLVVRIGSIPLTLGSGDGALLAGLAFGWYRSRNMTIGNLPTAAPTLLRDLGPCRLRPRGMGPAAYAADVALFANRSR